MFFLIFYNRIEQKCYLDSPTFKIKETICRRLSVQGKEHDRCTWSDWRFSALNTSVSFPIKMKRKKHSGTLRNQLHGWWCSLPFQSSENWNKRYAFLVRTFDPSERQEIQSGWKAAFKSSRSSSGVWALTEIRSLKQSRKTPCDISHSNTSKVLPMEQQQPPPPHPPSPHMHTLDWTHPTLPCPEQFVPGFSPNGPLHVAVGWAEGAAPHLTQHKS